MIEHDRKNPKSKKEEYDKIIAMLEKSQLEEASKTVGDIEAEAEDVDQTESPWTEEKEASEEIAPLEKAGRPEEEVSGDMRKRFSKKYEFDKETLVTGKKSSGKHDFGKTDKPADTEKSE